MEHITPETLQKQPSSDISRSRTLRLIQLSPFQLQVEERQEQKRHGRPGHAAREAHEEGEMRHAQHHDEGEEEKGSMQRQHPPLGLFCGQVELQDDRLQYERRAFASRHRFTTIRKKVGRLSVIT